MQALQQVIRFQDCLGMLTRSALNASNQIQT